MFRSFENANVFIICPVISKDNEYVINDDKQAEIIKSPKYNKKYINYESSEEIEVLFHQI